MKPYLPVGGGAVADMETGEVSNKLFMVVEAPKERSQFRNRLCVESQDYDFIIAERGHELGLDGFRVMHYLKGILDYENMIIVSQAEISRRLNMRQPHVSRAIKRLIDFGIIEKGNQVAGRCIYRLSPYVAWKGKPAAHRRAIAEYERTMERRMRDANIKGVIE